MITVDKAKEILQSQKFPTVEERLSLIQARGRFLSEPIFSPMDVPSFDNSAMDGYAFSWSEGINSLELVGEVPAGKSSDLILKSGQAVRIFTGAPIPKGSDTVVQQEKVRKEGDKVFFDPADSNLGMHVRKKGAQCQNGDLIAQKGSLLTPGMISLLASVGVTEVQVYATPKVALLITGDEIQEIGTNLSHGHIYNANGPALTAWLSDMGVKDIRTIKVNDEKSEVIDSVKKALEWADLILITGGISVGDYDFVKQALSENRVKELFYKVSQRPGKPLFAGRTSSQMVFALPGNPASVLSCFMNYVKPWIRGQMGYSNTWENWELLPMAQSHVSKVRLTVFLKSKIRNGKVEVLTGQESFNLFAFGEADGFAEIPMGSEEIGSGDLVKFYKW
ncbi:molybdopterin molybdotransferase MoeA [Algoriphagus sp. CAU 1675]|uniref:molybdopterin molybdotransferase MoeA n=1 Tax=Algoriphagus sp. CAU 1675 TaxID=3032597 RepID=UPI0023DABD04|nr:molybdopterin molybdotransferase MoeA [Algoriphagus sp. CAU 1675]MDF2158318.1 molybdopterin molybdotransferase MoeA [Algoriphagus sp. CAU 1675]